MVVSCGLELSIQKCLQQADITVESECLLECIGHFGCLIYGFEIGTQALQFYNV